MAEKTELRSQRKGVVTRHLNSLARNIEEENADAVLSRLERLNAAFDDFEEVHYDYHDSLSDEESLQESQAWFKDVEKKYLRDVKAARAWLRDKKKLPCQSGTLLIAAMKMKSPS